MVTLQGKYKGSPTQEKKRSELVTSKAPANSLCKNLKEIIMYARDRKI